MMMMMMMKTITDQDFHVYKSSTVGRCGIDLPPPPVR